MNETFYNILMASDVRKEIKDNLDYVLTLIPELKSMIGFEHKHPHHHLDVWEHTLYALSLAPEDFDIRLTLLLHDIGKPFSYVEEDGIRHFHSHANVSANISEKILKRMEYSDEYIKKICHLIRYHDTPISEKDIEDDYELASTLLKIQECDGLAHHPDRLDKRKKYLSITSEMLNKKR